MVSSSATTVDAYLADLPVDRRAAIERVREVILEHIPDGYEETMQYGMISYVIPFSRYPDTYNDQPLAIASLASQKHYMSLYLSNIYGDPETVKWFDSEYKRSGKKMNRGKSCVRFRTIDDLPLDLVGKAIARTTVDEFIVMYENARKS